MLTVDRVIVTENGGDYDFEIEISSSSPLTLDKLGEQEAGKESQDEIFQDV